MAINKKQTSLLTKVVLVFISLAFVGVYIPGLFAGGGSSDTPDTTTSDGALEYLSQQYTGTVDYYNQLLASEPTSYTVLLNQGYTYHDWAAEVQQSTASASGADVSLWIAATSFYERALAVNAGDPGVRTDMAVAYFYGGDTARAIENVEIVMSSVPEFANAYFNAGVFYQAAGRDGDALRVLKRGVELDPSAPTVETANGWIADLEANGVVPTVLSITSVEETSTE
ncbi:MAG: tetratricopeptide repeat protein [Actinomycetota bacterium]|nr:tetratricopeptide repeat protein [Actinomycetota bacterium]